MDHLFAYTTYLKLYCLAYSSCNTFLIGIMHFLKKISTYRYDSEEMMMIQKGWWRFGRDDDDSKEMMMIWKGWWWFGRDNDDSEGMMCDNSEGIMCDNSEGMMCDDLEGMMCLYTILFQKKAIDQCPSCTPCSLALSRSEKNVPSYGADFFSSSFF